MATIPIPPQSLAADAEPDYPTGDGKPLAETPIHRDNLIAGVQTLSWFFADDPMVYVSGNMFVYYEKGNPRKHVSPDVFAAFGVPKNKPRDAYFVWLEAHGPGVVIELTSKSTRREDLIKKKAIYQDKMPVHEYFLFDPKSEYLKPSLQGYRLADGVYVPIESVAGRLPSEMLGLELERDGEWLRFYNPASGHWLPTQQERLLEQSQQCERAEADRERAEADRERAEARRRQAEAERERAEAQRRRAEAERERAEAQRHRAEAQSEHERAARETAEADRRRAEAERDRLAKELEGAGKDLADLRSQLEQWRRRFGDDAGGASGAP